MTSDRERIYESAAQAVLGALYLDEDADPEWFQVVTGALRSSELQGALSSSHVGEVQALRHELADKQRETDEAILRCSEARQLARDLWRLLLAAAKLEVFEKSAVWLPAWMKDDPPDRPGTPLRYVILLWCCTILCTIVADGRCSHRRGRGERGPPRRKYLVRHEGGAWLDDVVALADPRLVTRITSLSASAAVAG